MTFCCSLSLVHLDRLYGRDTRKDTKLIAKAHDNLSGSVVSGSISASSRAIATSVRAHNQLLVDSVASSGTDEDMATLVGSQDTDAKLTIASNTETAGNASGIDNYIEKIETQSGSFNQRTMSFDGSKDDFDFETDEFDTIGGLTDLMDRRKSSRNKASNKFIFADRTDRYSHAQAKLYIVIHDLGGTALSNLDSIYALSVLASCSSISIFASMDNINTPSLISSSNFNDSFNWFYEHTPTYYSHTMSDSFCFFTVSNKKKTSSSSDAIEYIFSSLTDRHKDILMLLCDEICADLSSKDVKQNPDHADSENDLKSTKSANNNQSKGILMEILLVFCKEKLLALTLKDLRQYLKELIDQKIVSIVSDNRKMEFVTVNLPLSICLQYTSAAVKKRMDEAFQQTQTVK